MVVFWILRQVFLFFSNFLESILGIFDIILERLQFTIQIFLIFLIVLGRRLWFLHVWFFNLLDSSLFSLLIFSSSMRGRKFLLFFRHLLILFRVNKSNTINLAVHSKQSKNINQIERRAETSVTVLALCNFSRSDWH